MSQQPRRSPGAGQSASPDRALAARMILIMGALPDRALGSAFLSVYRLYQRAVAKGFSVAARGAFASYGARSVIQPPVRLEGEE